MRHVLGGDCWETHVSPALDFLSVGRSDAAIFDLRLPSPVRRPVFDLGVKARPMGWWTNPLRAIFQEYEDDCRIWAIDPVTLDKTLVAGGQWAQMSAAGNGHFVTGYGASGSTWDGTPIFASDWHVGGDGGWSVVVDERVMPDGSKLPGDAHIFLNGIEQRKVSVTGRIAARDYVNVREGWCGVGRNGPVVLIDCATGEIFDATVTPWRKESEPSYSAGWLATITELPTAQALVRPSGSTDVIALPIPEGAIRCDLRVGGDRAVVASWNTAGVCVVQDCDLTQPRHVIPPLPVPPDPSMQDCRGDLLLLSQEGARVQVAYRLRPDSGAVGAIRFLDNGTISQPADNALTHTYDLAVGNHTLSLRGVGKNGVGLPSNSFAVSVDAPAPPVPPSRTGLGLVADWIDDRYFTARVAAGVKIQRVWIGPDRASSDVLIAQFAKHPSLTPLYIAHCKTLVPDAAFEDQVRRTPDGSLAECGNECDQGRDGPKLTPAQYAKFAEVMRALAAKKNLTVYYGAIANVNAQKPRDGRPDGLPWLKEVLRLCDWISHVSFHRYNYGKFLNIQASCYGTRAKETATVMAVLNGRHFRVTEIGCPCGPAAANESTGFLGKGSKTRAVTEQQQLDYLRAEIAYWPGADGFDIYQENSGAENEMGLNALGGKPRLAWGLFKE